MTPILLTIALASAPAIAHDGFHGMCTASETEYFSCQTTGAKSLGLCGAGPGQLQYRFGKPGRPEFAYPAHQNEAVPQMRLAHYFRFQVDRTEVTFTNQGNDYALYHYTEQGKQNAGVRVTTPAGKEIDIACAKPVRSRLNELDGVIPCDEENALSAGACRSK